MSSTDDQAAVQPISPEEVARLRAATPGCEDRIHLNNAGASLMTRTVLEAQTEFLDLESRIGGYEAAAARSEQIEAVYDSCADLIGARPDQIAQVENATVAWNQAFHSARQWLSMGPGDRIITAEADYGANFVSYLQARAQHGIETVVAPSDGDGQVDVAALADLIDDGTGPKAKLISITHAPTNGGLVNPAEEIGAVAREAGVCYLLDACQTVGQMVVDVDAIGCDFLSVTGRKYLRGPRGTGFLYASDRVLEGDGGQGPIEPAVLDHHGADWTDLDTYRIRPDARRFENWEFNYAALVGLGRAADEALAVGLDRIEDRVTMLADELRARLQAAEFPVYDLGQRRCGLVTTTVDQVEAGEVKAALAARNINVSTSSPFSTLVDARRRNLPTLMRLSVHYFNTDDELDTVVEALQEIRTSQ